MPRSPEQIARGLGWLSIGVGVAQIFVPRTISRLVGVPIPPALMVLCGVRELACGIGILRQDEPRPWLGVRIAGDALDLAGIAAGVLIPGADRRRIAVATAAVAGITAADVFCERELGRYRRRSPPRHVRASIEVARPPHDVYAFWRDLDNLPRVMPHLDSVQVLDEIHSHWVAKGPAGNRVEWDAEIIDDEPNERLAWRSVDGSRVYNAGSVELQPIRDGGTRVTVDLIYDPPAGSVGVAIATLFGRDPARAVHADLRAFRHLLESGELSGNVPSSP